LDADIHDFIRFATDGAKRMDQMILHLLEYSRIGRPPDPRRPVPLTNLIGEALGILGPAVRDAGADIIDTTGPIPVWVHESEAVRLFQNLIANALKYRAAGRPLRISIATEDKGDVVLVGIADNGIGISQEQNDRIFRMFQRLHGRDEYGGGTGIGLAVCRKIVEHHGGRIWVESREGEGSTFFLTLPSGQCAPQPPGQ
jgi:two-component system CheB/CheR fusion protein